MYIIAKQAKFYNEFKVKSEKIFFMQTLEK